MLTSRCSQPDEAPLPPSSSGRGHHPFKVAARVRIPLGVRHIHHWSRGEVWSSRRPVKPEVAGSSPVGTANTADECRPHPPSHGRVAQSAERPPEKRKVPGSTPGSTTTTRASSEPLSVDWREVDSSSIPRNPTRPAARPHESARRWPPERARRRRSVGAAALACRCHSKVNDHGDIVRRSGVVHFVFELVEENHLSDDEQAAFAQRRRALPHVARLALPAGLQG